MWSFLNSKSFILTMLAISGICVGMNLVDGKYLLAAVNTLCMVYWFVCALRKSTPNTNSYTDYDVNLSDEAKTLIENGDLKIKINGKDLEL